MNNKYLLQDLTDQLSEMGKLKKKDAEEFLKAFFTVIEDALFQGEIVKVPGFGTFKLLMVDSRKSVNVTTGKEIEIKEHYKISFTPEQTLKDLVNQPFSHLEPVELDGKAAKTNTIQQKDFSEKFEPFEQNDFSIKSESVEPDQIEEDTVIVEDTEIVEVINIQASKENNQESMSENKHKFEPSNDKIRNEIKKPNQDAKRISKSQNQIKPTKGNPLWFIIVLIVASLAIWAIKSNREAMKDKERKLKEVLNLSDSLDYEETKPEDLQPVIKDSLKTEQEINAKIDSMAMAEKKGGTKKTVVKQDLNQTAKQDLNQTANQELKQIQKPEIIKSVKKKVNLTKDPEIFTEPVTEVTFPVNLTMEKGDRLTLMALRYYGNKVFWVYIYLANKNAIADPNNIPIGTKLHIPKPDPSRTNAKDPKCITKAKALQTKILSM